MTETTSVAVDCEEEGRGDGLRLRGVTRLALTRGLFLGRRVTMSSLMKREEMRETEKDRKSEGRNGWVRE
jgi:hypothetical protein